VSTRSGARNVTIILRNALSSKFFDQNNSSSIRLHGVTFRKNSIITTTITSYVALWRLIPFKCFRTVWWCQNELHGITSNNFGEGTTGRCKETAGMLLSDTDEGGAELLNTARLWLASCFVIMSKKTSDSYIIKKEKM